MMAGLLSLLRLDPMFSIYQKITSEAQKTVPAPRYDWLVEIDDFSIPSRSRPGPAHKIDARQHPSLVVVPVRTARYDSADS